MLVTHFIASRPLPFLGRLLLLLTQLERSACFLFRVFLVLACQKDATVDLCDYPFRWVSLPDLAPHRPAPSRADCSSESLWPPSLTLRATVAGRVAPQGGFCCCLVFGSAHRHPAAHPSTLGATSVWPASTLCRYWLSLRARATPPSYGALLATRGGH